MSMLSSYTLPSLAWAPGKFSPAALQLHKQPTAVSPLLALHWKPRRESRSQARCLFTCHANKFHIPPNGLVHPPPASTGEDEDKYWNIADHKDHITLMLKVGDSKTSKDDLVVATLYPGLLTIKPKDDSKGNLASELDVRLLMPPGCDVHKVKPRLVGDGWLEILITKPKPKDTYEPHIIQIIE